MGLAYNSLYEYAGETILDSLVKEKHVKDIFSICLGDIGGHLVLGGFGTCRLT